MGKSAPSPPPPPDPYQVASAQTGTNVNTAIANSYMGNANETNPYGSVNYNIIDWKHINDPNTDHVYDVPIYQRTVELSPAEQQKLDLQNKIALSLDQLGLNQTNRVNDLLSSPITQNSLLPTRLDTLDPHAGGNVQHSAGNDASYRAAIMSRLQPEMDRQRAQLETQLVNQGFQRGSQAFNTQMDQFGRQYNDAEMQALLQGHNLAMQDAQFANAAQQQAYSEALQAAQFQNTNRQQALQEQLALRNQPINEISALMSGGQVTMPQFAPYQFSPMSPAPVGQYVYNSADLAQRNYQSQLAQYNAGLSGMFGLGSSLLGGMFMLSDRRLKKNIRALGIRLKNGAKLYAYEYLGEAAKRVGVMADEIERIVPAAVRSVGGFKVVDYAQVWGR